MLARWPAWHARGGWCSVVDSLMSTRWDPVARCTSQRGGRDDFAHGQAAHPRHLPGVVGARAEAQWRLGWVLLLVFPWRHGADRKERIRRADVQAATRE